MKTFGCFALAMGMAGLAPAAELVSNPGFETLTEKQDVSEWSWWTREKNTGHIEVTEQRHGGSHALRVVHAGKKDWNLTNARKTKVKPGDSFKITCWMKCNGDAKAGTVSVVGYNGSKLVDWSIGQTSSARGEE